jgi:tetratricopeptide (TPR) repeat protein
MFAVYFWLLWQGIKNSLLDLWKGILLGGALITYLVQNLFVFDNLNTYLLLFTLLAYVDFTVPYQKERKFFYKENPLRLAYGTGLVFIIFLVLFNSLNIKPIRQAQALIKALQAISYKDVPAETKINLFQQALAYNTFGTTEVREQLGSFARNVPGNDLYTLDQQAKIVNLAIAEIKKEIDTPAKDIKHMIFIATILARAQSLNPSYGQEAEQMLLEAIRISPTKQILYFELAQLYLSRQKAVDAIRVLKAALDLEPSFVNTRANIVLIALLYGDTKLAHLFFSDFSETDISRIDEPILARLGSAFTELKDMKTVHSIYRSLVKKAPSDPKYHGILAAVLEQLGDTEGALKEAMLVIQLDPNAGQEVETFIKRLKQPKP